MQVEGTVKHHTVLLPVAFLIPMFQLLGSMWRVKKEPAGIGRQDKPV